VTFAGRALDLDDVGTEVGQGLRAPGTCEHAGEVEDPDPGERLRRRAGDGEVAAVCGGR
jgi:hypothetical protein